MKKIDMNIINTFINDELYELSQADKNTISNSIYYLMDGIEIDDTWEENLSKTNKSLERYVFDGVINFIKVKDLTADELYNYEDDCDIWDCMHGF